MRTEHVHTEYNRIQVFSATKSRDRNDLGDKVTKWLREYKGEITGKVVKQSSDHEFHCLSVVLFCKDPPPRRTRRTRRKNGG